MNDTMGNRRRFEAMFSDDDDPWRHEDNWYETRKRAMTMACLRRPVYRSVFEPGCANGLLTASLAARCTTLVASDGAAGAVRAARQRLAGLAHVHIEQGWVPAQWPEGRFDLIVISEFGYYLAPADLQALAARARASLAADGELVACHWRHPIAGQSLQGDAVHAHLAAGLAWPCVWSLVDPDFRLEIWSPQADSAAERQALRSSTSG